MASDKEFIDFIVGQFEKAGEITAKSMFGEYGIFSEGKMFALVCDNKLFFKPTESGRTFIKNVVAASPYPGAKPCFLIEEQLEDPEWLCQLARITLKELPEPKSRKKKSKK